jgi:dethiobiotin synthetase
VGWIGTGIDPAMARVDDNLALLRERLHVPCWGVLPFDSSPDAARMSRHLAWPPPFLHDA